MELINNLLGQINDLMYSYYLVMLLVLVGIFYTIRLGFVQFTLFPDSIRVVSEGSSNNGVSVKNNSNSVSPFQALMISTSSRVGIGNIVGISTAIVAGGPGSMFWMWVMAIIGGATAFAESTLAQVYKTRDGDGFKGGPAYYMQTALNARWAGCVFAVALILTYAYGFNGLQAFTLTSAFEIYKDSMPAISSSLTLIMGLVLAIFGAVIFFNESNIIGRVAAVVVPVMAVFYILLSVVVLIMNYEAIPSVLKLVVEKAFDMEAIFGGFAGSAVVIGIKRGLFSNEAGMGSAPNAAASAHTSHPVKQGLVQSLSVLIDCTVCTATAFLVLFSIAWANKQLGSDGQVLTALPLVQTAMKEHYGSWGAHFVSIAVVLFAITSLIGNYYYAWSNIKFISENKVLMFIFRATAVGMIFVGAQMDLKTAWNLADTLMAVMATINLIAVVLLSGTVKKVLDDYKRQKREGVDPVFVASKVGIKNAECW